MSKWPMVKLHAICRPRQWPTIGLDKLKETGFPVYGANGKIGFYDDFTHEQPTVLITCRGATCGTVRICEAPSYVTGNAMALDNLDAHVDRNFLARFLSYRRLDDVISGSAQPQITGEGLRKIEIPKPHLEEQRRIAAILDQADALRTKRRQALAKLDSLTQSLFLKMFGELDSMSRWPLKSISEVIAGFDSGKSVVADDLEIKGGYRVLKVSAVGSAEFFPLENKPLPVGYIPPDNHFVHQGDLLFSRANTAELVGLTAYVWEDSVNIALSDKLWKFKWQRDSEVSPLFIRQLFRQEKIRSEISRLATGTSGSMKNISQGKLMGIKIPVPPIALQIEFTEALMTLNRKRLHSLHSLYSLDAFFQSLQHRAFRGKL